jgi:hypothetical protein
MGDLDLKGLREVLAKMSPGPWKVCGPWPTVSIYQSTDDEGDDWEPHIATMGTVENGPTTGDPDAAGIVALRNSADALLSRLEELEAWLREAIDLAEEGWGYATPYFRDKWESNERADRLRLLLAPEAPRDGEGSK